MFLALAARRSRSRGSLGIALAGLTAMLGGCGDDPRPAVWAYIAPVIMQPSCATQSCHSRAAAVAGLDFSDPDRGFTSLTGLRVWVVDPMGGAGCMSYRGQTVCQRDFRPLITPFNPEQSRLVNMLRARGARRMPPDRPLTEADIRLVEKWIRNGARHPEPTDRATTPVDAQVVVVTTGPPGTEDGGVADAGAGE